MIAKKVSQKIILVIVIVLCSQQLSAQWYIHYEDALKDIKKSKWKNAVKHIDKAIKKRPTSKVQAKTSGLRYIDYFPYLYRGIAKLELEEWTNAAIDLRRVEEKGLISKANYDTKAKGLLEQYLTRLDNQIELMNSYSRAIKLLETKDYAAAVTQFELAMNLDSDYKDVAKKLSETRRKLEESNSKTSEVWLTATYTQSVNQFNRREYRPAKKGFEEILTKEPGYRDTESYLKKAIEKIRQLEIAEVEKSREEIKRSKKRDEQNRLNKLLTNANKFYEMKDYERAREAYDKILKIDPANEHASSRADQISDLLANTTRLNERDKTASNEQFNDLKNVSRENSGNEIADRNVNAEEPFYFGGIMAFYNGENLKAINILSRVTREDNSPEAYAVLACAYATQFFLNEQANPELRDKAVREYQNARSLDFRYTLSAKFISPKIISLLEGKN